MTIIDFDEKGNPVGEQSTLQGMALEKIKPFYKLILILVIASIFFALGRLSALERGHTPIKIENSSASANNTNTAQTATALDSLSPQKVSRGVLDTGSGEVIGSKSGKKYYFPWCGTVSRIKPENQVHFTSIEDARKSGFTPGGNCKGLK